MRSLKRFWRAESGATAIEYAVIAAFISVVAFGALTNVGGRISDTFQAIANNGLFN